MFARELNAPMRRKPASDDVDSARAAQARAFADDEALEADDVASDALTDELEDSTTGASQRRGSSH